MSTASGKTLTKKRTLPTGNQGRPVTVTITANFPKTNARKVTPADLENAGVAAALAFKTALEARTPAYEIHDLVANVNYSYIQVNSRRKL